MSTTQQQAPDDAVVARLSTLDRFLPVWILVAMAAGLLLGRSVSGLDDALARVEVASVDKVVPWSTSQAQALFTMRVAEPGTGRGAAEAGTEIQAVAQLLQLDDEILVCSYVQRTG